MKELRAKISNAIANCESDAIMVASVDNFVYLSRTVLPFAYNYPYKKAIVILTKEDRNLILCPFDWSEAVKDQGWDGEVVIYDENNEKNPRAFVQALKNILESLELDKSKIGIDTSKISKGLMDTIHHALSEVKWFSIDSMLRELRLVKTNGEVELIEKAAKQSDKGIIYALNHLEGTIEAPGYTVAEFSEVVRTEICESGGSGIGLLSTTFGSDSQLYYAPQRGRFKKGELFRVDVSNHYLGYWSNIGRMAVTGQPTSDQVAAYKDNLSLKEAAVNTLKPGVACNEVYKTVRRAAKKEHIPLWVDAGMGHGVGVSHYEPPYLSFSDATILKQGMVLVLDIYTHGPCKELIHSKDIYKIERGECRLLSWYRNWDKLYVVTGFRATH